MEHAPGNPADRQHGEDDGHRANGHDRAVEGNKQPTDRERSAWLKVAQDLAKQGKNGWEISLRTSLKNA